ncbi:hypothetical protein EDD11_003523 [Mortierella claussenii]|nr:hypothetical protein EDD11_003523 [Mortierella claussenii]
MPKQGRPSRGGADRAGISTGWNTHLDSKIHGTDRLSNNKAHEPQQPVVQRLPGGADDNDGELGVNVKLARRESITSSAPPVITQFVRSSRPSPSHMTPPPPPRRDTQEPEKMKVMMSAAELEQRINDLRASMSEWHQTQPRQHGQEQRQERQFVKRVSYTELSQSGARQDDDATEYRVEKQELDKHMLEEHRVAADDAVMSDESPHSSADRSTSELTVSSSSLISESPLPSPMPSAFESSKRSADSFVKSISQSHRVKAASNNQMTNIQIRDCNSEASSFSNASSSTSTGRKVKPAEPHLLLPTVTQDIRQEVQSMRGELDQSNVCVHGVDDGCEL